MNKTRTVFTRVAAAAIAASLVAVSAGAASAGHRHKHRHNGGDLIAAGVVGAVIGTIIGSQPVYGAPVYGGPVYAEPVYPRRVYVEPRPVYVDPGYGQPVYGEPVYGEPVYEQPVYGNPVRPRERVIGGGPYDKPIHRDDYNKPRVVTYDDTVQGSSEPWSQSWFDYCRSKYRSFDSKSGTFMGYDGIRRFCVVK